MPEHSGAYREVRLESLKNHPEAFETTYEKALKQETFFFEKPIIEQDERKFVMGAFYDGVLIGICAFVDDNLYELDQTGSLVQMYVKREYAGNKIGEKLLLQTEFEALKLPNLSKVMLEVNKNNNRAICVYQNCGYKQFKENGHLLCMAR